MAQAQSDMGGLNVAVNCAGIGWPRRMVNKEGPLPGEIFRKVIEVNLIGTLLVAKSAAGVMVNNTPNEEGERGVIVMTASVAAFDGQIGQVPYSASKGGIVGMTLPMARDLAGNGIRVMTIAPGVFKTPMVAALRRKCRTRSASRCRSLRASVGPRNTRRWSRTSARTRCSTANASASTARSAWRPSRSGFSPTALRSRGDA